MTAPDPEELTTWVHRGVALFCLGALIPGGLMAADQVPHLAPWWLALFGAGILGITLAMVILSLIGRAIGGLAIGYLVAVAAGTALWPLAWTSPEPASGSPWLWMCLGAASLWTALVFGTKWGFSYALATGAVYAGVRLTPSGQGVPLVAAMQDLLVLVINPSAVIIGITLLTDAIRRLNATAGASQQQQARATVEETLVEERRRLDSIVHDEVMTTLVNATMAGGERDPQVVEQARHAIRQLERAGETSGERAPVTVEHLGWLITDQVTSLVPDARAELDVGDPGLQVPAAVASAIGQACREVAKNIARHAEAGQVTVRIEDAPPTGVRVTITDDGVGFDLDAVPSDRFGLRHSVLERMSSVGGRAEVISHPGDGTSVQLVWEVAPATLPTTGRVRVDPADADLPQIETGVLGGLISLLIGLHFVLGWTTLDQVTAVWPVLSAQLLAAVATWLALRRLHTVELPRGVAIVVVVLLTGTTLLVQSVLPMGRWPGYATWHSSVVMVLLIVLLFRRQATVAWVGVGIFVAASSWWAYSHGLGPREVAQVTFGPVAWMVVAQLVSGWLLDIGARVHQSRLSVERADLAIAQSYSRLVLRDLWLSQLQAQVGPLLQRLADPEVELTEADLAACRTLERRLRDGLRAANLLTEGTQDIIESARARGVEVNLVDSRGSVLPDPVRRALRQSLAQVLDDPSVIRVVARAAPEGYDDLVTLLTVRVDGRTELVGLDENGVHTSR
ncbi:MAG: ATP-binding protein [Propionicimonas sp.]